MIRHILLPLLLLLALCGGTCEPARAPAAGLTLLLDPLPDGAPVIGEMVLATLRGENAGHVTLEKLEVPAFEGLSWMQLGPPTWSDQVIGNRRMRVYEVWLAIFPKREGRLTIGAVTHHLTFAEDRERIAVDVSTEPVTLDVAPTPPLPPGVSAFWLPARSVTIRDEWHPAPDSLGRAEWASRDVTVEVEGLPLQELPAAPPMAAGGLFSVIDPEERAMIRTPDGPVSTIVWHYRLRPQTDVPADLDDIPVTWFDTGARRWREEILWGAEIAFEGTTVPQDPGPLARHAIPAGFAGGLCLGLLSLLPRLGFRSSGVGGWLRRWEAFWRAAIAMRRAEALSDWPQTRAALIRLLHASGADPAASATLRRLDEALFSRAESPPRMLRGLTAALRECRRGTAAC